MAVIGYNQENLCMGPKCTLCYVYDKHDFVMTVIVIVTEFDCNLQNIICAKLFK
jgi:hypothetical protein